MNNQLGRAVTKRCGSKYRGACETIKAFMLPVTGSLGFDYAQVTKGGVPLAKRGNSGEQADGRTHFAGEILDADGEWRV
ncbi:MAG: hypothetical protein ACLS4Z_03740 [Christensenellaceae bacterium]